MSAPSQWELDELRKRHSQSRLTAMSVYKQRSFRCVACNEPCPCLTVRLIDWLEAQSDADARRVAPVASKETP